MASVVQCGRGQSRFFAWGVHLGQPEVCHSVRKPTGDGSEGIAAAARAEKRRSESMASCELWNRYCSSIVAEAVGTVAVV